MKILYGTDNGESLAILDQNNYAIGKVIKNKKGEDQISQASYYSSLSDAVKELCKREADTNCTGLKDWIVEFRKSMHYYDSVITNKLG